MTADLTVIGAGPAGLAATVAAAGAGLHVTLVDLGARLGGQYWRHGPGGLSPDLHHGTARYLELAGAVNRHIAKGRVTYLAHHHVWVLTGDDAELVASAVDRGDPGAPRAVELRSRYLVLATGAYDRAVPFPGWDLPGVMTTGAASGLLKESGVVAGQRVLVAGTGPFLLPVAAGLAVRGATVAGVHEAGHPAAWLRRLPVALRQLGKMREALSYTATFARHRVPVRYRSVVLEAHGSRQLEAVTVGRTSRSGAVQSTERLPVDALAVGHGFTAQTELAIAAGCQMRAATGGGLAVVVDDQQRTSRTRVFAAGEITGVGGAELSLAEGALAGAAVAHAVTGTADQAGLSELRRRRDRLRTFAAAIHEVYPATTTWLDHLRPDTVVCRCEEVSVAEIEQAVELGGRDLRTVKLLSRSGMGWCQGRECADATTCLLDRRTGHRSDPAVGAARPIASPVPLGLLAETPPTPTTPSTIP